MILTLTLFKAGGSLALGATKSIVCPQSGQSIRYDVISEFVLVKFRLVHEKGSSTPLIISVFAERRFLPPNSLLRALVLGQKGCPSAWMQNFL
jgi:hypothetical protein